MSKRRGFTLVEIMVASGILVVVLVAFLGTYDGLIRSADYSRGLSFAFSACRSKLEELLSRDFSRIPTDYGPNGTPGNIFNFNVSGFTGNGTITITDRRDLYGGGWFNATDNANWTGRERHTALVYDNKMWVMGGRDCVVGSKNGVWYSTDGVNWTNTTDNANWTARYGHTALVYDNKMWVMGGANSTTRFNDVWYSPDGRNWYNATDNANWTARYKPASLVYDNKMWVMGGTTDSAYKNDVWYSADGINWFNAINSTNWTGRQFHTALVYDNKMWVMGGWDGSYKNDTWYSTDGVNWTNTTDNANWTARYGHTALVYDNKMWVMGGTATDSACKKDVWYSSGYNRLLEIGITLCWRMLDGRVIGEDTNLNGALEAAEDMDGDGIMDSPAKLKVFLSEDEIPNLRKIYLGRQ